MPDRASVAGPVAHQPGTVPADAAAAAGRQRGRARTARLWRGAAREVRSRWDVLAVIAAGGALGSLARWGLATVMPHPPGSFPLATFLTNITGSFLLGVLMALITLAWPPSKYLRPFAGVGVLGGFTTFSTYMLDTRELLVTGHATVAGWYLAGTLLGGLAAIWAGTAAIRSAIGLSRRRAHRDTGRGDATTTAGPAAAARPQPGPSGQAKAGPPATRSPR